MDELDLTAAEVEKVVAALMSRHPAFTAHERFITDRLTKLARRACQHGANAALLSLRSPRQVATEIGVTKAWVIRLAARHGIGERMDDAWLFTPQHIEELRGWIGAKPGPKRKAR